MSDIIQDEITPAQHYAAGMDSVRLIDRLMALPSRDVYQVDAVNRNVAHLELIVTWDIWTTEDLAPFHDAIATGQNP
jgi:hypothetical protein